MLLRHEIRRPRARLGRVVAFADGTSGRVYRETAVSRQVSDACVLVVCFRLRAVRGRGHVWFRAESLLNTPLFVGFPGRYRGVYEWDGPERATHYARSLWRVLELVSDPGSIDYRVIPGHRRDDVLDGPDGLEGAVPAEPQAWWLPVGVPPGSGPRPLRP
jgi:hypothetical protein